MRRSRNHVAFLCGWVIASFFPDALCAIPFTYPRPQYECIGNGGEIHVVSRIGELKLGEAVLPVDIHFRGAKGPTVGILPDHWACPLVDSHFVQQDARSLKVAMLDGSLIGFSAGGGKWRQDGQSVNPDGSPANWSVIAFEGQNLKLHHDDASEMTFSMGRLSRLILPKGGTLVWRYEPNRVVVSLNEKPIAEIHRVDSRIDITLDEQRLVAEVSESGAICVRLQTSKSAPPLLVGKVDREQGTSTRAELSLTDRAGSRTYVFNSSDGTLISDGEFTYKLMRGKGPDPLPTGVLRADRQGREEGSYFDDDLGTNEVISRDGTHLRYYTFFVAGRLYGKTYKLARVVGGHEELIWHKEFDQFGRVLQCREGSGRRFSYRYSSLQPFPRTVTIQKAGDPAVSLDFDKAGRIVRRVVGDREYKYTYVDEQMSVLRITENGEVVYDISGT